MVPVGPQVLRSTPSVSDRDDAVEALRILHVVPYFPPDRVGGVGEVAAHVHAELLRRGHDSRVLTSGRTQSDPRVLRTGRTPDGFVLTSPLKVNMTRWADVLHVHHGEALGLLAAMKILRIQAPILLTLHASPAKIGRSLRAYHLGQLTISGEPGLLRRTVVTRVRQAMDRAAMVLANQTTFIARSTAVDYLGDEQAELSTTIYNGLPEVADKPSRMSAHPAPVELLYVGSYSVRKRVQALPIVLEHVRRKVPGARLRIVGFEPTERPEFMHLARVHGVHDAIVSPGVLHSEDIAPYYRAAQVLLVPSAYEGLPMVIMEAMQNGLPCVATRVSGHPEIIEDEKTGFLTPLDNPSAMAEAAVRILCEPSLAERVGAAGREAIAKQFALGRQVERYLDVYRTLAVRLPT